MADAPVSIRERKYIRNPLLGRRQFIVEVIHPGKANCSRAELKTLLSKVSPPRHKLPSAPSLRIGHLLGLSCPLSPRIGYATQNFLLDGHFRQAIAG